MKILSKNEIKSLLLEKEYVMMSNLLLIYVLMWTKSSMLPDPI